MGVTLDSEAARRACLVLDTGVNAMDGVNQSSDFRARHWAPAFAGVTEQTQTERHCPLEGRFRNRIASDFAEGY